LLVKHQVQKQKVHGYLISYGSEERKKERRKRETQLLIQNHHLIFFFTILRKHTVNDKSSRRATSVLGFMDFAKVNTSTRQNKSALYVSPPLREQSERYFSI